MTEIYMNRLNSNKVEQCDECIQNLTVTQRRELVFSEFKRKSKIRIIFKDCPVSDMSEMLDRFKAVLEERIQEEEEKAAREAFLKKEAESILTDMAKKGIDVELLREIQQGSSSATSAKVKYIKDGITWTGQGRRPAPFKGLSDYELEKYRKSSSGSDDK